MTFLLAATIAASGCGDSGKRDLLMQGRRAYDLGQYGQAVQDLSAYLDQSDRSPQAAAAYYVRGLSRIRLERRAEAYADLKRAAGSATGGDVSWRANVALASLYFDDGDWGGAGRAYQAAARAMPAVWPLDVVLLRIGQCHERLGLWNDAQAYFRRLVSQFPSSSAAESARRRLETQPTGFSIQCGAFGLSKNADSRRAALIRAGLDATVRTERRGDRTLYVVYAGSYATYAAAQAGLTKAREYEPEAMIWP